MNIHKTFMEKSSRFTALPVVGVIKGLPDHELLNTVQSQTLRYFWENAHPYSGMIRERKANNDYKLYNTNQTVASGGTGFGIMALLVGAEREWLTREEVCGRITKIVGFLEKAENLNGVFPHFLNGKTGKANFFKRFGKDNTEVAMHENGGNLVETAYLFMGLLTARQYFSGPAQEETELRNKINTLWHKVEWDSHLSEDGKNLQWLKHPTAGLGHWPVTGWNEAMITHVMAVSSPTHSVSPDVYKTGWCSGQEYHINGNSYYGHKLPLGPVLGGPLFFSQYSFLGLDPTDLTDGHTNFWSRTRTIH